MSRTRVGWFIGAVLTALVLSFAGCGGPPSLTGKPASELWRLGKEAYDKERFVRAVEVFQQIVYNFPGENIVDTAQYYLALSYYSNREYQLAGVEFNRLTLNYPTSKYATSAQFMKAAAFYESTPNSPGLDQSDLTKSIQLFEDFLIDHPESEMIPDAQKYLTIAKTRMATKLFNAALVYTRLGNHKAAGIYYQKVIDEYTSTEPATRAIFSIAEGEYKMRNYDLARDKFDSFARIYPDHQWTPKAKELAAKSTFKAAEVAFTKGDLQTAQTRLESLKHDYPASEQIKHADELLARIKEAPVTHEQETKTGS